MADGRDSAEQVEHFVTGNNKFSEQPPGSPIPGLRRAPQTPSAAPHALNPLLFNPASNGPDTLARRRASVQACAEAYTHGTCVIDRPGALVSTQRHGAVQ